jgi:hypothetical protein
MANEFGDLTPYFNDVHIRIPVLQRSIIEKSRNAVLGSIAQQAALPLTCKLSLNLRRVGALLHHVQSHPKEFAAAVVQNERSPDFGHLVRSSIPSVFGHFGCQESLSSAFTFYQWIMIQAPPDLSSALLAPLLNSGICARFVESFFAELRTHSDHKFKKSIISQLLEKYLCLFPREVVRLFPSSRSQTV